MTKLEQAASGKPIAEQTNTQLMEGFRPVSEMIAEHKQDPKKAAAIEKAKMRKAEQEPVAWFVQYKNRHEFVFGSKPEFIVDGVVEPLYAHPVRTKDLTDDEIVDVMNKIYGSMWTEQDRDFARAVIAADREKNRGAA